MPKSFGATDHSSERSLLRRAIRLGRQDRLPLGTAAILIGAASLTIWAIVIFLILRFLA
jgi:hypothetical protein